MSSIKRSLAGSGALIVSTLTLIVGLVLIIVALVEAVKGGGCVMTSLPWIVLAVGAVAVLAACPVFLFLAFGVYLAATIVVMNADTYYRTTERRVVTLDDEAMQLAGEDIRKSQYKECDTVLLRVATVALIILWDLLAIAFFVLFSSSVDASKRLMEYKRSYQTCFCARRKTGRRRSSSIPVLTSAANVSEVRHVAPVLTVTSKSPAKIHQTEKGRRRLKRVTRGHRRTGKSGSVADERQRRGMPPNPK